MPKCGRKQSTGGKDGGAEGSWAKPTIFRSARPAARRREGKYYDGEQVRGWMVEPRAPGRSRPFSGRQGQRPEGAGAGGPKA